MSGFKWYEHLDAEAKWQFWVLAGMALGFILGLIRGTYPLL